MALNLRASKRWRSFSVPISYRIGEARDENRLFDAQNVFSNQGRLETRHGFSRINSSRIGTGSVRSMSYFEEEDGTRHIIVKVGTSIWSVTTAGVATEIKTGLTDTTLHKSVTINGRHIIVIGNDGIFWYDGTNFAVLGNGVPAAPTIAASSSGNNLDASDYRVRVTFYASTIGFETNGGTESSILTVASGERIDVTGMATSATHPLIDKKRVYFRDYKNNGNYLFHSEISLATATATIDENAISTQIPPTGNASPPAGGAKFISKFNRRLAYTANNNQPSDLRFTEPDVPDGTDLSGRGTIISIWGDGPPTGLGTGYYQGDTARPYLIAFKKRSITLINDAFQSTLISDQLGCVSASTIRTINGDIYFLSAFGWRSISNGRLVLDQQSLLPLTLGGGDIDDLFKTNGFEKELNKADFENMFSVYYSELDQYITFVSEGASLSHNAAYPFEFETRGFKRYAFQLNFTAAVEGEDSSGNNVVYLADTSGFIYSHSIQEDRTDTNDLAASIDIEAFALMPWIFGDDLDGSRNFREFIVHAIASSDNITVRHWTNFELSNPLENTYTFTDPADGFILDVSKLDEDALSDPDRTIVKARGDLNRVGISILIGFFQSATNANLKLIRAQLDSSVNGNPN